MEREEGLTGQAYVLVHECTFIGEKGGQ